MIARKRRRSKLERRQIVEETLEPGASVGRVARAHEVNANQVFHWRKLYQAGLLEPEGPSGLLPVRIADPVGSVPAAVGLSAPAMRDRSCTGAIHIQVGRARLRIEGAVDPGSLRIALECLLG